MNTYDKLRAENPGKYPSNMGKSWSKEEHDLLLKRIADGFTIEQAAEEHGRTIKGVKSRLHIVAEGMAAAGMALEEIMAKTGLDKSHIDKHIYGSEPFLMKKPGLLRAGYPLQAGQEQAEILQTLREIKGILLRVVAKLEDQ
jgi:hypothetical protein